MGDSFVKNKCTIRHCRHEKSSQQLKQKTTINLFKSFKQESSQRHKKIEILQGVELSKKVGLAPV